MRYLETQVRVVNTRLIEERPVCHNRRLFIVSVQMHASARDLFAIEVQCKIIDIQMREMERILIQGA